MTEKMQCLNCKTRTEVIDSRTQEDGTIKRRRECTQCHSRFSTQETRLVEPVKTVKPVAVKPVAVKKIPVKKLLIKPSKEKSVARKESTFEEVMGYGSYEDLRDIGFNIDSWKND